MLYQFSTLLDIRMQAILKKIDSMKNLLNVNCIRLDVKEALKKIRTYARLRNAAILAVTLPRLLAALLIVLHKS